MRIDHDGVGLDVRIDGPDDGPTVLFLHGISSCAETYDFLVPEFPDHRIVRLDFRGHGRSGRAPGRYLLNDYAGDVIAVLTELGTGAPVPIVGHSLGGITAAHVAVLRPDLVRAVFLEDPPLFFGEPGEYDATPFAVVFPLIRAAIERWQADDASAADIAVQLTDSPSMSGQGTMGEENWPDAVDAFGAGFARLDTAVYDPVFDGTSLSQIDRHARIPVPGVLLQPDRELGAAFYDEHAAALSATSPDVHVVRVPGVGHLIHDSRTQRSTYLDELRRFLATHAPVTA